MFSSLKWKLSITYLLIIVTIMTLSGFFLIRSIENYYLNNTKINYLTQANILSNLTAQNLNSGNTSLRSIIKNYSKQVNARVLFINRDGRVLIDSFGKEKGLEGEVLTFEEVESAVKGESRAKIHYIENGGWVLYVAVPVFAFQRVAGVVMFSASINSVMENIKEVQWQLITIFLFIGIIITLISFMVATYINRPIGKLTRAVNRMAKGDLSTRVKIYTKDEIGQLAQAFDKMGHELERYDKRLKSFVANASHELRSPLSSIKVMVESLLNEKEPDYKITREFLTDINKEIDRLTRLIKNLMELTRMDKMKELNRTEFNLTDLIEEVVEKLKPLAKQKQLTVNIRAPQNFEVYMDYERIFRMVANLVDNAFKYNVDNGVVEISCKREDNNVVLTISDTGIGIPEENIHSIFERFVRVEKSRTRGSGGFGLGLALVKEIVELHKGKIEVESTINEGTTFKVILPDVKHG